MKTQLVLFLHTASLHLPRILFSVHGHYLKPDNSGGAFLDPKQLIFVVAVVRTITSGQQGRGN